MALLFCDGFDHYNTAHLYEKWESGAGTIVSGGREGQGLQLSGDSRSKNLGTNAGTLMVGFARQVPTLSNVTIASLADNGVVLCSLFRAEDQLCGQRRSRCPPRRDFYS